MLVDQVPVPTALLQPGAEKTSTFSAFTTCTAPTTRKLTAFLLWFHLLFSNSKKVAEVTSRNYFSYKSFSLRTNDPMFVAEAKTPFTEP